ncbi:hypothetical protein Tco_1562304 [Tanacetum coccineum]
MSVGLGCCCIGCGETACAEPARCEKFCLLPVVFCVVSVSSAAWRLGSVGNGIAGAGVFVATDAAPPAVAAPPSFEFLTLLSSEFITISSSAFHTVSCSEYLTLSYLMAQTKSAVYKSDLKGCLVADSSMPIDDFKGFLATIQ